MTPASSMTQQSTTMSTSHLNDLESIERDIAAKEDQIVRETAELIALRKLRNAHPSLPLALPPELLSEIFLYCRDAALSRIGIWDETHPWLVHLHTCAHWRAVALADPRLWDTHNLRFPYLIQAFAPYSGTLPLHVVLSIGKDLSRAWTTPGVIALAPVGDRISMLELYCTPGEMRYLRKSLDLAADNLVSIRIGIKTNDLGHLRPAQASLLYEYQLPKLHTLDLEFVDIHLACMRDVYPRPLRAITLKDCYVPGLQPLAALPYLETLTLDQSCPELDHAVPILLPALKSFTIAEVPRLCIALFRCVQLSPSCRISVTPKRIDMVCLDALCDELIPLIAPRDVHAVHMRQEPWGIAVEFETEHGSAHRALQLQHPNIGLQGGDRLTLHALSSALAVGAPRLYILVDRHTKVDTEDLMTLSAECVRTLSISAVGFTVFVPALAECLAAHAAFLPGLERLDVRGGDFSQLRPEHERQWRDGVIARRGILKEIVVSECTGEVPGES